MQILKFIAVTALIILLLVLLLSFVLYLIVFYSPKRNKYDEEYHIPSGKIYEPYHDFILTWMKNYRILPHKEFTIRSFDGLTLYANYYEYSPDAPIELMFHGYRGTAERDLSIGIQRCFSMGRNAFIVDQRASCRSDGNVISFGINEHRDCLSWIDFVISHFGTDTKIILTGISMGASTVLMAAGHTLPSNVAYVLADCGYSSAHDIIKKCIRQLHLPANLLYPFIKLGARLYGHFNLDESSPLEAMNKCQIPVVFIHGLADDFVPHEMSIENYEACQSPKKLLLVPDAGHGLSYLFDQEAYINVLMEISVISGLEPKNLHSA